MSTDINALVNGVQTGQMANAQISTAVLQQIMASQQVQANAIIEMVQDSAQMAAKQLQTPGVGGSIDIYI